jgi:hypothetical protein
MTRDDIIEAIRNLANAKGRKWLSRVEFFKEAGVSNHQLFKHFSRWNEAVEAAGLEPLTKSGRPD